MHPNQLLNTASFQAYLKRKIVRMVTSILMLFAINAAHGQIGGRIGTAWIDLAPSTVTVQNENGIDTFDLFFDGNQGRAFFLGFNFRLPLGAFFLEAEPALARNEYSIRIQNPEWEGSTLLRKEAFNTLDLSLMAGVRLWKTLRLQGGVAGQLTISTDSDLEEYIATYENNWSRWVESYQLGIGLDIVNVTVDFVYQNTLDGIGADFNTFGNGYTLNPSRQRFLLKLGLNLIGKN